MDDDEEEEEEEEVTMVEGETTPIDGVFYVDICKLSHLVINTVLYELFFQIHILLLEKEEDSGAKSPLVSV